MACHYPFNEDAYARQVVVGRTYYFSIGGSHEASFTVVEACPETGTCRVRTESGYRLWMRESQLVVMPSRGK